MCGTVKWRPALAYRVHFDGNNISNELITRYYTNEKLAQCCFNVRPTSATLANIKPTFGDCAVLAGKALNFCQYAGGQLVTDPHGNTTVCVSTQSPQEGKDEVFTLRCRSSI